MSRQFNNRGGNETDGRSQDFLGRDDHPLLKMIKAGEGVANYALKPSRIIGGRHGSISVFVEHARLYRYDGKEWKY